VAADIDNEEEVLNTLLSELGPDGRKLVDDRGHHNRETARLVLQPLVTPPVFQLEGGATRSLTFLSRNPLALINQARNESHVTSESLLGRVLLAVMRALKPRAVSLRVIVISIEQYIVGMRKLLEIPVMDVEMTFTQGVEHEEIIERAAMTDVVFDLCDNTTANTEPRGAIGQASISYCKLAELLLWHEVEFCRLWRRHRSNAS